jgi:transcriptional regulator with XRE-family HTH domain
MTHTESLSDYVRRIMYEKSLTTKDVENRSGKKIDRSYISKIISGTAWNLTVGKIQALALGLGVPEEEIFFIASGKVKPETEDGPILTRYKYALDLRAQLPPGEAPLADELLRFAIEDLEKHRSTRLNNSP